MPKFKVGAWVEAIGILAPIGVGKIIRIIPHPELGAGFDEYEVQFEFNTAFLYETQLRPAPERV